MNKELQKLAALGEFVDRDTMRFVREYPHPVERVWAALVTPEQISVWWMVCETLEAREGGRYVAALADWQRHLQGPHQGIPAAQSNRLQRRNTIRVVRA